MEKICAQVTVTYFLGSDSVETQFYQTAIK